MPENSITIVGNVTRDIELKFLNSGQPAGRFTVAVSKRWQNRQTQEWEERVSFFEVSVFGPLAENAASSIHKGSRVIVTGRLEQRTWETEDGQKRSVVEVSADDIALSVRFAVVSAQKAEPRATRQFDEEDKF